jgi:hypothetical protein
MNTNKFARITKQILAENRKVVVNAYLKCNDGPKSAILINLDKEILKGKANLAYYIVSESKNQPLYNIIPDFMKGSIVNNSDKIYVIFKGWDGLVAGYFIGKNTLVK